jgi:hypothetical protein
MEQLRELGRNGVIADWVDDPPGILNPERVRGVGLDIDDYWLSCWENLGAVIRLPGPLPIVGRPQRSLFNIQYDFTWRPLDWLSYCRTKGYPHNAHPVRVVVALRDRLPVTSDYPRDVAGIHPIIYEVRGPAIAHVQSGDYLARSGVPSNQYGTVGGFLFNPPDQAYFAVTCAHVLQITPSGVRVVSPRPTIFGHTIEVGRLQFYDYPKPSPGKCNNRIGTNAPKIDAATIVMDSTVNINLYGGAGKISKISPIADLGPNDEVEFYGATSGKVEAKVAQATIWYEIEVDQIKICFGDLYSIKPRGNIYFNTFLSQPGDSGSWIVHTQTTGPYGASGLIAWDGMLIAGDGAYSYCCYAESVFQALTQVNGSTQNSSPTQGIASLILP